MKKEKNQSAEACKIAKAKKTSIGGQALMEGIMMRGPQMTAMAVRKPDGEIVLEAWKTQTKKVSKFFKLPIIRGVYGFITSMTTGYKALMRSAEISGLEELEAEMAREKAEKKKAKKAKKAAQSNTENTDTSTEAVVEEPIVAFEADVIDQASNTEAFSESAAIEDTLSVESASEEAKNPEKAEKAEKKKTSALTTAIMVVASVLGVVLAIGLFIMLPTFLYDLIPFPSVITDNKILNSFVKSAFEGILKIAILVGYMALVSLMKDIRRTFQYHGAEHKTIFCYESGTELTVENVRNQRRFHPRCGTAFLVLMLIVGMFVSFFIDPLFYLTLGYLPHTAIRALLKLATLPIVMGIGYELIKLAGRHDNIVTRIISAPGLWLQRLTVLEPTDDMIECAIIAFKEVIPPDQSDNY